MRVTGGGNARRVPPRPEIAVASRVEELLRKFDFRDADTRGLGGDEGGAGGAPTIGVAAFNATPQSKEKAEFDCVGTGDETVIMDAMAVLYQFGGGRLWLSEGTFSIAADVVIVGYSIAYPAPILMIGMGNSTRININTGVSVFGIHVAAGCEIRDLQLGNSDGGG
jgi:hypothetical protein